MNAIEIEQDADEGNCGCGDANDIGDDGGDVYDGEGNGDDDNDDNSNPEVGGEEKETRRDRHCPFLERDFGRIRQFWSGIVRRGEPPPFLVGDSEYGITDLRRVNGAGSKEFASGDPRFRKKTFALCIMYNGSTYNGYQQQKGVKGVHTVEDDLDEALGRKVVAAGRTDMGVSAISQIVSFATFDEITPEDVISKIKTSAGCCGRGSLNILDCQRVPKKFNALFSATWRRYIYMFPLNSATEVDVAFIKEALSHLENKALPYNSFAYRENRELGEGSKDICTLFRTNASIIDISNYLDTHSDYPDASPCSNCPALCIELVGNRFLRRMVRILTATVIRESIRELSVRNIQVLEEIALSGDRSAAAWPVSGLGLAMAGVGYDLSDLAVSTAGMKRTEPKKKGQNTCLESPLIPESSNRNSGSEGSRNKKRSSSKMDQTAGESAASDTLSSNSVSLKALKLRKNDCAACLKELDNYLLHIPGAKRVLLVDGEPDYRYVLMSEKHSAQEPLDSTILGFVAGLEGASIVDYDLYNKRLKL